MPMHKEGDPVSGATVLVFSSWDDADNYIGYGIGEPDYSGETGENGELTITGIAPGNYVIVAYTDEFEHLGHVGKLVGAHPFEYGDLVELPVGEMITIPIGTMIPV